MQPGLRRSRAQFVCVHRAIRFANGFEQNPERAGNIEIVIERGLKIVVGQVSNLPFGLTRKLETCATVARADFAQPLQPFVNAGQRLPRFFHSVESKIQLHAIVDTHQGVTHFAPAVSFGNDVTQGVKIAERFRHFLIVDQQVCAMHPVAHKFFPGHAFALRNLCFMMRKNVIDAAAVNVELIAEQCRGHGATFDMPPRPSPPPGRIPANIAVLFIPRFPKREVADVFFLVLVAPDTSRRPQLFQIQMRQLSVFGKFIDAKVDRLVLRLICEIAFNQLGDHLDHAREIVRLGRARIFIGAFDPQSVEIFKKSALERFGESVQRNFRLPRPANGFVIDIGDVHHPMHFEAAHFEVPLQQIFENVGAKISNVRVAINRRSAGVHRDIRRVTRGELLQRAGVSVEEMESHLSKRCNGVMK